MNRRVQHKVSTTYIDGKSRIVLIQTKKRKVILNNEYPYDCMQQVKVFKER